MMISIDGPASVEILEKMPYGILIVDKGQVTWTNQTLAKLLHVTKDRLIGLEEPEASNSVFAPLFENSERLCITESSGQTRWFKREYVEFEGIDGIVHFFKDVTGTAELEEECSQLRKRVDLLETKDPVTGLLNKKAILQVLDNQLSRSRRYGNPLSVLRLSIHSEETNDLDQSVRDFGQSLKDQLRWADQIGILEAATFLIVLPETCLDDAKELASNLTGNRTNIMATKSSNWSIKFGVTSWHKGDDPKKLLRRLERDQELGLIALMS